LGGEGFLYAYSVATGQWTAVASMNNRDYDSIVYHPQSDLIYAYGHDQNLHKLNAQGQVVGDIDLPQLGLHVGPGGYQTEMVMVGSKIALLVEADSPTGMQLGQQSRIYIIDPNTGAFEETYRKIWPAPQQNTPPTVRLVQPTDGAFFEPGASVLLRASATDSDGMVVNAEFTANGVSLGAGAKVQIGGAIFYQREWRPSAAGTVSLYATALDDRGASTDSQPVGIRVGNPESTETIIGIVASDPEATEFSPLADAFNPARFIISRSGDRSLSTTVFLSIHGTAQNGVDYQQIPTLVTIPAGQGAVEIVIVPISPLEMSAAVLERMETVGFRLEPSPLQNPMPSYQIDPSRRTAAAVIYERTPPASGALEVAIPGANTTYFDTVQFLVPGYHPTADIMVVNYFVDGRPVGSSSHEIDDWIEGGISVAPRGGYTLHQFGWTGATLGHHVLQARTVLGDGQQLVSSEIPFVVHSAPPPPVVRISHPANGAIFIAGNSIPIQIAAFDPNGTFGRVELYAGRGLLRTFLSPTDTNLTFTWPNAPVGQHTLFARATSQNGVVSTSDEIRVVVQSVTSAAFVERDLPNSYSAGIPFLVTLRATPPAGTLAYAVEDFPPAGWVVTEISHEGSIDPRTRKVKFGPYTDAQPRSLTYRVRPNTNSMGRAEFVGSSSRNGAIYPIRGDQFVEGKSLYHPADRDQNYSITISELTGYAAAWKSGAAWSVGPSPIRSDYVTRAGLIWKRGETYRFVAMAQPPHCWAPIEGVLPPLPPVPSSTAMSVASTERIAAASILPGTATQVRLNITPGSGAAAFTVEEKVPTSWGVSNVDQGGSFDPETGIIRWGLFLDANPRSFSYTVTAPSAVASVAALSGSVSVDGEIREISGTARVVASSELTEVRLTSTLDSAGRLQLDISSAAGQTGVIEVSIDLKQWTDLQPIYSPDGSIAIIEPKMGATELRFYRFRIN
ncbi:MAG: Ig-like domain-containing protein, partial [Limisphaerales bacterium]